MQTFKLKLLAMSAVLWTCQALAGVTVSPADTRLQYTGRVDFANSDAPLISWPGTAIEGGFTGASLTLKLDDQLGKNYFNVFIDGDLARPVIVEAAKGGKSYPVATGLAPGPHRF